MGVNWPQAYILGLRHEYRGLPLETQLKEMDISFVRVDGVDARTWNPQDVEHLYSRRGSLLLLGREMGRSEIACAIGHQRLMQAFLDSREPWAFLFEDDVEIRTNLKPIVDVLPRIGGGANIVLLESRNPFGPDDEQCSRIEWANGFLWKRNDLAHGAGAYMISREAAELAVRRYRHRRIDSVADWPAGWARDITFWQAEPLPVTHSTALASESFLAQERDAVVASRPMQQPSFRQLVASRIWRYSGAQMLYGLALGVPARDSFYVGIVSPRAEKRAQRKRPSTRQVGHRGRLAVEEITFRFVTTTFGKLRRRLPVASVKTLSKALRLLGRTTAANTYQRLFDSLAPNFDPLRAVNLPPICLLVVAAPKDFGCLPMVIRGASANVRNPIASAFVVTTSAGMAAASALVREIDSGFPIYVECEEEYIDAVSRDSLRATMGKRYGWLLQQFLNLAFANSRKEAGVLAIDADTVFLRPRVFLDDAGVQILTPTYGVHDPYYQLLDRLGVAAQDPVMAFVPHFMLYQPDLIRQLLTSVAQGGIESLISAVLASVDVSESSPACVDFELYAQYLLRDHPERVALARWSNTDARAALVQGGSLSDLQDLYKKWGSVSFHGYLPLHPQSASPADSSLNV